MTERDEHLGWAHGVIATVVRARARCDPHTVVDVNATEEMHFARAKRLREEIVLQLEAMGRGAGGDEQIALLVARWIGELRELYTRAGRAAELYYFGHLSAESALAILHNAREASLADLRIGRAWLFKRFQLWIGL